MFRFILKNASTKKARLVLTALTIIISCMVGLLAMNVSKQVEEGIISIKGGYDLVIGPAGSESQLAFNSLLFSDDSLGTIDHEIYEELAKDSRINYVVPLAQGDTYRGNRIVGTTSDFITLANMTYDGEIFDEAFEAVVGYNVAKDNNLKIGDQLVSSHGAGGVEHADKPYTVVGILDKTNTNYDNTVFTDINSVWQAHGEEGHDEDHEEGEEHDEDEEHEHNHGLTSILVKSKSIANQMKLKEEYSNMAGIQAINPTQVLRESLESVDLSKQIVFALCAIIFGMSIILLFIITMLSAQDLKNDIKLMRLIGITKKKIFGIFTIQSALTSILSLIIAFFLGKLGLIFVNNISTGYGIVVDPMKVYGVEYIILGAMFIVTLIPTIAYISKLFRKDISNI